MDLDQELLTSHTLLMHISTSCESTPPRCLESVVPSLRCTLRVKSKAMLEDNFIWCLLMFLSCDAICHYCVPVSVYLKVRKTIIWAVWWWLENWVSWDLIHYCEKMELLEVAKGFTRRTVTNLLASFMPEVCNIVHENHISHLTLINSYIVHKRTLKNNELMIEFTCHNTRLWTT